MAQNHMVLISKGQVYFHRFHFDHFQIYRLDQQNKKALECLIKSKGSLDEEIISPLSLFYSFWFLWCHKSAEEFLSEFKKETCFRERVKACLTKENEWF